MKYRPKPFYISMLRKEEPIESNIDKLISIHNKGGVDKFEDDVAVRMGKFRIEQIYYTNPITQEKLKWLYVGNFWWVRKITIQIINGKKVKKVKYEFARLMAYENKNGPVENIVGLWDARIHELKVEPIVVYEKSSGRAGVIVSYNDFEVVVEWEVDGIRSQTFVRDINDLEFKFTEDFKKFCKVFKVISKHVKKIS